MPPAGSAACCKCAWRTGAHSLGTCGGSPVAYSGWRRSANGHIPGAVRASLRSSAAAHAHYCEPHAHAGDACAPARARMRSSRPHAFGCTWLHAPRHACKAHPPLLHDRAGVMDRAVAGGAIGRPVAVAELRPRRRAGRARCALLRCRCATATGLAATAAAAVTMCSGHVSCGWGACASRSARLGSDSVLMLYMLYVLYTRPYISDDFDRWQNGALRDVYAHKWLQLRSHIHSGAA